MQGGLSKVELMELRQKASGSGELETVVSIAKKYVVVACFFSI